MRSEIEKILYKRVTSFQAVSYEDLTTELLALFEKMCNEVIPLEAGSDLHVCKPKAHTIDPQTEGYADYSHLPKEYANCIDCGAVPSKQRFETMTETMMGWNNCRNEAIQALAKYFGESTE